MRAIKKPSTNKMSPLEEEYHMLITLHKFSMNHLEYFLKGSQNIVLRIIKNSCAYNVKFLKYSLSLPVLLETLPKTKRIKMFYMTLFNLIRE